MTIRLNRGSDQVATAVQGGGLWLRGTAKNDSSYAHSQYALVSIDGGSIASFDASIIVQSASNVTIVWDAESLFYHPEGQASYEKVLRDRVESATNKGYHAIKRAAVVDHQKYYNRASFTVAAAKNYGSEGNSTARNRTGIDTSPQSDRTLMCHLYSGFVEISEAVGSDVSVENAKQYLASLSFND